MKHPAMSPACQHALLAQSPLGHVSVCPDCGVVHLSLNCVSVRLEVNDFKALAGMVSQAHERLHSVQPCESLGGTGQAALVH